MSIIDPQYDAVVHLEEAVAQMGDDPELLQEIVEIFLEGTPDILESTAQAIAAGDVDQTRMQAHSMKGSASNICAVAFVEAARQLEYLAADGGLDGADALMAQVRERYSELERVLATVDWSAVETV
ncbi:MAG: Hpt domain-containing protein [bacterium]|nr:Hpt domain-containing protein [bacterium]